MTIPFDEQIEICKQYIDCAQTEEQVRKFEAILSSLRELRAAKKDAARCEVIRNEVIQYNTVEVTDIADGKPIVGNLCAWADATTIDSFNAAIDAARKEKP